ncbi:phage major capsid protein [Streptomyces sp. B1I3]|uniref:phage major capsid protein n=1 Tax=Streptomyces sp. B1I3 TaxID=3042264 RepID=UPI0027888DA6|nr:phage major capsid protein [Streptomyces sp. B1I3]MDQ0793562.1 HK97 family phage major capsid protein [Streptomyces sp. B1I3]
MANMARNTAGVNLPLSVSDEIWGTLQEASAVMQLARKINLPGSGVTVPMVTGDAVASWVNETDEKPVSDSTVSSKSITPYKIAVIETFSNEFKRDIPGLYAELARRLPAALALAFDKTVFHATTAPGSNFDLLEGAPVLTVDATNTYADLVAVDASISNAGGVLNGFALSPKGRGVLLAATDSTNRPLFISNLQTENGVSSVLGSPVVLSRAAYKADAAGDDGEVIGFAGDWSSAVYGTVNGIEVSMSDQATVTKGGTQLNLWQRNMFALRAEVEIGFAVSNLNHFVKITSGVNSVA